MKMSEKMREKFLEERRKYSSPDLGEEIKVLLAEMQGEQDKNLVEFLQDRIDVCRNLLAERRGIL